LAFKHPHYLSVTDLKFNEKQKKIEGYVKIFTHDFESALKKEFKRPIDLLNPADTSATRKILEQYLLTHLTIQTAEKKIPYHVIGFENEQESIYMYVESNPCVKPKTVDIKSTLLYESFREQTNIVHFEVNAVKKSSKVTNPATQIHFDF